MIGKLLWPLNSVLKLVLIVGVRFYQCVLRPMLPSLCRFEPSCSEYFVEAVQKYGPVRGSCKGIGRICRCNPWSEGGFDPP